MLSSIQTVNNASGNQAPRSSGVAPSTEAAASEDETTVSDRFAAVFAALMPASPAPLSAGVPKEAVAGRPRFDDSSGATLPGSDATKMTLDASSAGAPEQVARPEGNAPSADGQVLTAAPPAAPVLGTSIESGGRDPAAPASGNIDPSLMDRRGAPSDVADADGEGPQAAADHPQRGRQASGTTATFAARVAVQLTTEAVADRPATTQVPSLPGDEGEPGLHPIANRRAEAGATAIRALPPDLAMRPATRESGGDSVAWPGEPDDETFPSPPSSSVGPSEALGLEPEIPAAARISAGSAKENRVGHAASPSETPSPDETADAAGTSDGTTITDPSLESAPPASPGSGTLTTAQGNPPVESAHRLPSPPPEILRQNIRHIAETTRHLDRGTIEITLSPEELGHVRLTVKSHDITGTTVVLQADRPETLDLMRRHVELLAQDMRDFGYRELTFAFQDRRPGDREAPSVEGDRDDGAGGSSASGKVPGGTLTAASRPVIQDGRLDIRL